MKKIYLGTVILALAPAFTFAADSTEPATESTTEGQSAQHRKDLLNQANEGQSAKHRKDGVKQDKDKVADTDTDATDAQKPTTQKKKHPSNFGGTVSAEAQKLKESGEKGKDFGKWVSGQRRHDGDKDGNGKEGDRDSQSRPDSSGRPSGKGTSTAN